jgi:hypothetical protein
MSSNFYIIWGFLKSIPDRFWNREDRKEKPVDFALFAVRFAATKEIAKLKIKLKEIEMLASPFLKFSAV